MTCRAFPFRGAAVVAMAASLVLLAPLAAEEENSTDLFKDIPAPSTETPASSSVAPQGSTGGLKISGQEELTVPIPADPVNFNYRSEARAPALRNLLGLEYRLGDLIREAVNGAPPSASAKA
jgi:hypothetical protein